MSSKLRKKIGTGAMVLLITACLIPATAGAFASGNGGKAKGFDGRGQQRFALGIWRSPQMVQHLNLTDPQIEQIRDVDFTFREKGLVLKAQLDSLRLQMDRAFSENSNDDSAILKMAQQISDLRGKLFVQGVESRLAVGKLLNADQIKKLKLYDMHPKKRGFKKGHKHDSKRRSAATQYDQTLSDVQYE
jgi:Spy/CpxP family protein refolding chaperone